MRAEWPVRPSPRLRRGAANCPGRERPGIALTSALLALLVSASAAGRGPRPSEEKLVPAKFSHKQDALGFLWDLNQTGAVRYGSNACFSTGLLLLVNGSQFNAQSYMMTADGSEYVLSRQMSGVNVTRRILVDVKRGAARYIETFANAGANPVSLAVAIRSRIGGTCQQVVTDSGAPFTGSLGKKDVGVLTVSTGSRPCVLFLVGGTRSKTRPLVSVQSKRTVICTYNITVKPQKSVSLVHLVAQRKGVNAANVADLVKGFYNRHRLVRPGIPRHLRRTVANFRVGGAGDPTGPGPALRPVLDLAEELGVERGACDILIVGEEGHLRGEVTGDGLSVEGIHGKTAVDLADVALFAGGAGLGRVERLYLRSGEILVGSVDAEGMRFKSESGLDIELAPSRVDMIFTTKSPADGVPPPGAVAFVDTRLGERLALVQAASHTDSADFSGIGEARRSAEPLLLRAATPWGPISVTMSEVKSLSYVRDPQPCYRLVTSDDSSVPVVLTGPGIRFRTLRFGELTLPPQSIEALQRIEARKVMVIASGDDAGEEAAEPAWAQAIRGKLARKVSFKFDDTPLVEAIAFLQTLTKTNILIAPAATEAKGTTPITLKVTDMKLEIAFDWILRLADLDYALLDEAVFVSTAEGLKEESGRVAPAGGAFKAVAEEDEPKRLRKLRELLERKVSFEFVDTPLNEAVEFLGTLTKVPMALDRASFEGGSGASVPISLRVLDMPLRSALRWIGRFADVDYVMDDEAIKVTNRAGRSAPPKDEPEGDDAEIAAPHFTLVGEHVLVGTFEFAELDVATAAGAMPVDPKHIHVMERVDDEERTSVPSFTIELADGSRLSGALGLSVIPIRWGGRVLKVPARHVREYRNSANEPGRHEDEDDADRAEKVGGKNKGKNAPAAPPAPRSGRSLFGPAGQLRPR